ncbi:MAG: RND family transporter [Halapricum sp.]
MIRSGLSKAIDFVTEHNLLTLALLVVLSVAILAGIPLIDTQSQAGASASAFDDVTAVQKAQYVQAHYQTDDGPNRTFSSVYVRKADGNVLSKASLLDGLRYQRTVRENASVRTTLYGDGVSGLSNLVATRAVGDSNATLDQQIAALENESAAGVEQLVGATLANDPRALRFLPADHDPSETTATDRRMLVALSTDVDEAQRDRADAALYHTAKDRSDAGFFVLNSLAYDAYNSHFFTQMIELVLPAALILVLGVLAFTYRDLVDVIVGMAGVVLSVLWMFGLLGWLGVSAGLVSIVPVVLVSGLSIDFGFHVFNRYREQREAGAKRAPRSDQRGAQTTREHDVDEGIRAPMGRGVKFVTTALLLVTVTSAIGFLANVTNPLGTIRNLGISITLGIVASLFIFVTAVPALKITIDSALERLGLDRHKQPLGHGRFLRPILQRCVTLARRGAPVVLVVAILVGAGGGAAWMGLHQESFQQPDGSVAQWKQDLPDPIGWDPHPVAERLNHVDKVYQPASADAAVQEPILIEGNLTSDGTLDDVQTGVDTIRKQGVLVDQPGVQSVQSPVTAMQAVAEHNASFAAVLDDADTDHDGVPDEDLKAVYDAFYAADSRTASRILERTDGQYRSALATFALDAGYSEADTVVSKLDDGAAEMEGGGARTATVAGNFGVNAAVLDEIVGGILTTMLLALAAIVLTLAVVFKLMHGSATLGLVVSIPIALVMGLVIGGMYVLSIPLTLLTALLMSLVIGMGVDYNIHVGDRFADELREGKSTFEALDAAVTGTGGALLGSTLTSAGAFATITLVPHPQLQSFGSIVVIALTTAFLVSLLVLPSLLVLWSRYSPESVTIPSSGEAMAQD